MGKRIGIYLIGLAINALGIALIIYSALGAGRRIRLPFG